MKRINSLFLAVALILGLCACAKGGPTWQEQYDLGVRYLSEGNYEEAIIAFTAAIEIDAKRPEAYISLAEVYTAQGDTDAARNVLEDGFAATGDGEIRALLDGSAAPTDDVEQGTEHEAAAAGTLALSSVSYSYAPADYPAGTNDGAVGELTIRTTADGPDGLSDVWIATWYDEIPDEETLQADAAMMADMWAYTGEAAELPFVVEQSRPVDPEELGKTQYVLLVGLNETGEAAAYAVVDVKIPG